MLHFKKTKAFWKTALLIIGIGFVLFLFIWFLFEIHTDVKVKIAMAPLFLSFLKKKILWWIGGLFFGVYLSVLRFISIASSYGLHFPMEWLESLEALQQKPLLMDGGNALGFPRESSPSPRPFQNLGGGQYFGKSADSYGTGGFCARSSRT